MTTTPARARAVDRRGAAASARRGRLPAPALRITEGYTRMVAREAYFWAWPLLSVYNRRLAAARVRQPGLVGGVVPVAPLNRLVMLAEPPGPLDRWTACPDPDVLEGWCVLALDRSPVVVQVPDFGRRFWVYRTVDLRTDSFARLGVMYDTLPGFYLLAGPDWSGEVPAGIREVFRSATNTGVVAPQVFPDDIPDDQRELRALISGIDMYPLSEYDGRWKRRYWQHAPSLPGAVGDDRWVAPEKFLEQLPLVLREAPPLPGEEARYAGILALLAAAAPDPVLREAIIDEARKADHDVVGPLNEFRNHGIPLPHHWTTTSNGAEFGTDYFARTAAAKLHLPTNTPAEAKCFYQDFDANGTRLNSRSQYEITFAEGRLPPVNGFWSLTPYNERHLLEPNTIRRYSVGTRSRNLRTEPDGSLTLHLQADPPENPARWANWLPSPAGQDFSLVLRACWPGDAVLDGSWTPPPVKRVPG